MEIKSFRVENFRSIQDTKWQPLSVDSITVLVGRNESGKSSILDALELGYSISPKINPDDFRYDDGLPRISISVEFSDDDIADFVLLVPPEARDGLQDALVGIRDKAIIVARVSEKGAEYFREISLADEQWSLLRPLLSFSSAPLDDDSAGERGINYEQFFNEELWKSIPEFILFNEATCTLPNRIDIENGALSQNADTRGAGNFIKASGLNLSVAISGDHRRREAALSRASSKITRDLQEFWSQILGKSEQISLECELKYHDASDSGKAGQPYLAFWVREGDQPLYPSQRSRGTRWFISFFLELRASSKDHPGRFVLLDEPANFLHPAAQGDVIRLLENLAKDTKIVYSTHSPYMLDQQKLHRVLAVERHQDSKGGGAEVVTKVSRGLELATASQLTLAPILGLIGVDFSHQQVIKKNRNVLLEEISAQYYIRAFITLLDVSDEVHLVACSGVDTVRTIADLFIAWGIGFTILVDADSHGKRVVRDIKSKYQLSDSDAKRILQVIDDCEGIEDIFCAQDFSRHVLKSNQAIEGRNSLHVKKNGVSKPLIAMNFNEAVKLGEITVNDLSQETITRVRSMLSRLLASL